jgi:hypothetical protein
MLQVEASVHAVTVYIKEWPGTSSAGDFLVVWIVSDQEYKQSIEWSIDTNDEGLGCECSW